MADYDVLLDSETQAFIAETGRWYPPESAGFSIERQREVYDALCTAFHHGRPDGLAVADRAVAGVPCRVYGGGGPAQVVYFHGGGWVVGGLDSHDDVCAEIADRTGFGLTAVDYRLSPEHRHPRHLHPAFRIPITRARALGSLSKSDASCSVIAPASCSASVIVTARW